MSHLYPPDELLIVYGSLRPGEENFSVVSDIAGEWFPGTIKGRMGTWSCYLRVELGGDAPDMIPVQILRSAELPLHWARLDRFEGTAYERVLCPAETERGPLIGNVYVKPVNIGSLSRT